MPSLAAAEFVPEFGLELDLSVASEAEIAAAAAAWDLVEGMLVASEAREQKKEAGMQATWLRQLL